MWSHLGQTATVWPGRNYPLGATWSDESTNFAVYAPAGHAGLGLPLRRRGRGDPVPAHRALAGHLARRAARHRTRAPATATASTARGLPKEGLRFNPHKLLLDPYGQAVSGGFTPHPAVFGYDAG